MTHFWEEALRRNHGIVFEQLHTTDFHRDAWKTHSIRTHWPCYSGTSGAGGGGAIEE
ncbi:MAG: hypothetical protein PPP56_00950 [Longimonas sp.]|uniref:hypothetical protein n=1 Tax=Longimonas sp. TaxID=2039626 RepID=UPI0033563CCD